MRNKPEKWRTEVNNFKRKLLIDSFKKNKTLTKVSEDLGLQKTTISALFRKLKIKRTLTLEIDEE